MAESSRSPMARRALVDKYVRAMLPQNADSVSIIPRRAAAEFAPLTVEQQDLWRLARAVPDTSVYTECVTLHLPGPLDVTALERSFSEIIRRHEAWRTSFPVVDGQPIQWVHPAPAVGLPSVDLRGLPEPERQAAAIQMAAADASKPFDLANGPLLRARLVRTGDVDHRLFLTLHYIIFDGVTLYQILLPELHTLYDAFRAGQPSPLAPLPIQHADYAQWQREWLRGGALSEQMPYWRRQLAGSSRPLTVPTDYTCPAGSSHRGAMHPFAHSLELTAALKELSRWEGVTLFMTLLAAFSVLLHGFAGHDDILLGTKTAGRKRPELQGLMGYFLHILPLRINLAGNPTFRELLRRAREVAIGAIAHEDVPLEYLLEVLRQEPGANLGDAPFPAMLVVEPPLPRFPSGWTITQMDVDTQTSKCDFYLELDDRPEGLVGRFEYRTDLFAAATIARMTRQWLRVLESVVADPTQRLSELSMLTVAEQHQSP